MIHSNCFIERIALEDKIVACTKTTYYPVGKRFMRKLVRVFPRGKIRQRWIKSYLINAAMDKLFRDQNL